MDALSVVLSQGGCHEVVAAIGFFGNPKQYHRVFPDCIGVASRRPDYICSDRVSNDSLCDPSGVRVNTVHPGSMPPMLNATNAGERADKIAMTPLQRIGKPIEVAYGVLFLASDETSFITGTELVIDGGFIAQ
jgi:hypothetical protein